MRARLLLTAPGESSLCPLQEGKRVQPLPGEDVLRLAPGLTVKSCKELPCETHLRPSLPLSEPQSLPHPSSPL